MNLKFLTENKLFLSALIGYGLLLTYVYQLGYYNIIGFQFASLTPTSDYWSSTFEIAQIAALLFVMTLITSIATQLLKRKNFDAIGWIANHETGWGLAQLAITLTTIPIIINYPTLFPLALVNSFFMMALTLFSGLTKHNTISLWTAAFTTLVPLAVCFTLGTKAAIYNRYEDRRLFAIQLENERISPARLVRISNSGIIIANEAGNSLSYLNLSKIVKIEERERVEHLKK